MTQRDATIKVKDLTKTLEPLIRRVVREELARVTKKGPEIFYLDPGSPLYKDMEETKRRKEKGQLKFHSYKEVWGE